MSEIDNFICKKEAELLKKYDCLSMDALLKKQKNFLKKSGDDNGREREKPILD